MNAPDERAARLEIGRGADSLLVGAPIEAMRSLLEQPDDSAQTGRLGASVYFYAERGMRVAAAPRVDGTIRIAEIRLDSSYSGSTADGIGLDSARNDVAAAHGSPAITASCAGTVRDVFHFPALRTHVHVHYARNSRITTLVMRADWYQTQLDSTLLGAFDVGSCWEYSTDGTQAVDQLGLQNSFATRVDAVIVSDDSLLYVLAGYDDFHSSDLGLDDLVVRLRDEEIWVLEEEHAFQLIADAHSDTLRYANIESSAPLSYWLHQRTESETVHLTWEGPSDAPSWNEVFERGVGRARITLYRNYSWVYGDEMVVWSLSAAAN